MVLCISNIILLQVNIRIRVNDAFIQTYSAIYFLLTQYYDNAKLLNTLKSLKTLSKAIHRLIRLFNDLRTTFSRQHTHQL